MMAFILSILNLCRKELMIIFKDPASRIILTIPPMLQAMIFGYAANFDLVNAPYALLDQSRSALSREWLAHLDNGGVFHRVASLDNPKQIAQIIDSQKALFVIHIDEQFEKNILSGRSANVQLILDARNSNTAALAAGSVATIAESFNATLRERYQANPAPLTIITRAWFNPNLETRWNILPGLIATLNLIQTMILSALTVAREREQGTFDQLLVTPLIPTQIMLGKAIPAILIGVAQSSLILLVSLFWFQVPMVGSIFTLYAGLLLFTIASVGIGLSVSALSANMQQAMLYSFVLLMPMVLLSGLMTPVSNMPKMLQYLTAFNPLRFAIDLIRRVYLEGLSLADVSYDLWPMIAVAAITLPVAAWLFRYRLV